ncbi:MAG: DUF4114 domain-containing protein [Cyanobacterium sp. T60_A2020_053]|nr:DUF4114 domain-containing protein [Cyanobacterium sp. T60_A2020_053]
MENQFLNVTDSAPLGGIIGEIALMGINYTLDDPSGNFLINPITGEISLVNQLTETIDFNVTVTDTDNSFTVVNVTVNVFPSAILGTDDKDEFDSAFGDAMFIGLAQTLFTLNGDDIVDVSQEGTDNFIDTGRGNDTVFAGTSNEIILGKGDDRIFVGSGDGGNIITGGIGADQFWLVTDEEAIPTNINTVTDFNPTEDVIGFASTSFNLDNKGDRWDYRRVDGDVIISALGDDIAILLDTTITDGNFVFGANVPMFPDVVTVNLAVTPSVGLEEDETVFTFTVTADNAVTGDQNLSLIFGGTAVGADFIDSIPDTITIADGATSASFTLQIFDDLLVEGTETATFTLGNPSDGIVIGDNSAVSVTIEDNNELLESDVVRFTAQEAQLGSLIYDFTNVAVDVNTQADDNALAETDADFNNIVGLYKVENMEGAIFDVFDVNNNGATDDLLNPNDDGYAETAIRSHVNNFVLQLGSQGNPNLNSTAEDFGDVILFGGEMYAPFVIANGGNLIPSGGTIEEGFDAFVEKNPDNIRAMPTNFTTHEVAYFGFTPANPDGTAHLQNRGNNVFGFEDLPGDLGISDFDFNDAVFRFEFTPVNTIV